MTNQVGTLGRELLARGIAAAAVAAIGRAAEETWQLWRDRLPAAHETPPGWRLIQEGADGCSYRTVGGHMTLIESTAREDDGRVWHHVSIARRDRIPTWEELAAAKEAFIGPEREAYVVLPSRSRHVNIHPRCLHLWACLEAPEADGRVLPRLDAGTGSI